MKEIEQFLEQAIKTRNGLNGIINKIQEKLPMTDAELILIEKIDRIYEEGTI